MSTDLTDFIIFFHSLLQFHLQTFNLGVFLPVSTSTRWFRVTSIMILKSLDAHFQICTKAWIVTCILIDRKNCLENSQVPKHLATF